MSEDRSLLRKLLREHYETAVSTGADFDLHAVIAAATADPAIELLAAATHAEACIRGIRAIDNDRRKRDEAALFGDDDQVVALPSGKRRRKGSCGIKEVGQHLGYVSENAAKVNVAAAREHHEAGLLMPYLAGGLLWEQAKVAYAADHPDESA